MLAAFAALAAVASAAPAAADVTVVEIDHATRIKLNGAAASVFTGNASIADVAIINSNTMMVIGKGFGVTNVVALDGSGRTIMDRRVQVSPGADGRMTLYRGVVANNFACSPMCERTPMPGEPNAVFEPYNTPVETYQKRQSAGSK